MFAFLYFAPKVMLQGEQKMEDTLKLNVSNFTSKTLEQFASSERPVASEIVTNLAQELNESATNPITGLDAFIFGPPCAGCVVIQPDDNMGSVIITAYDKTLTIVARTVMRPPSFVTYERDIR
jgi:hypothetical protein